MRYISYNPNPKGKQVGDCVIRALTKALGMTWGQVYTELCAWGYDMADMPSSNAVWGAYLKSKGFRKHLIPDSCPDCYTIGDFADDHPHGDYIVGTGTHVVFISSGTLYDSWNSLQETVFFYFVRGDR